MLDHCPGCDYPLAGLPANHMCPECGLAFDERSHVYHRKPPSWPRVLFLCAAPLLAFEGWVIGGGLFFPSRTLAKVTGVSMLASAIVAFVQGLRYWRRRHIAAVLPAGLYVRYVGRPEKLIPWTTLEGPVRVNSDIGLEVPVRYSGRTQTVTDVFRQAGEARRLPSLPRRGWGRLPPGRQKRREAAGRAGASPASLLHLCRLRYAHLSRRPAR